MDNDDFWLDSDSDFEVKTQPLGLRLSKQDQKKYIFRLPDELILEIVNQLGDGDKVVSLLSLRRVSQRLRGIVCDAAIWRRIERDQGRQPFVEFPGESRLLIEGDLSTAQWSDLKQRLRRDRESLPRCSTCLATWRRNSDHPETCRFLGADAARDEESQSKDAAYHCAGCDAHHPRAAFSQSQWDKPRNDGKAGKICIGREGHVRLCEHVQIGLKEIEKHIEMWKRQSKYCSRRGRFEIRGLDWWETCLNDFEVRCDDPSHLSTSSRCAESSGPRAMLESLRTNSNRGAETDALGGRVATLVLEWQPHSGPDYFTTPAEPSRYGCRLRSTEMRRLFKSYRKGPAEMIFPSSPACPQPEMLCFRHEPKSPEEGGCECLSFVSDKPDTVPTARAPALPNYLLSIPESKSRQPWWWRLQHCKSHAGYYVRGSLERGVREMDNAQSSIHLTYHQTSPDDLPYLSRRMFDNVGRLVERDRYNTRPCLVTTYRRKIPVCCEQDLRRSTYSKPLYLFGSKKISGDHFTVERDEWWNPLSRINPTHEWFHAVDTDTRQSMSGEEFSNHGGKNCSECSSLRFDICGGMSYRDLPLYLYGRCCCADRRVLQYALANGDEFPKKDTPDQGSLTDRGILTPGDDLNPGPGLEDLKRTVKSQWNDMHWSRWRDDVRKVRSRGEALIQAAFHNQVSVLERLLDNEARLNLDQSEGNVDKNHEYRGNPDPPCGGLAPLRVAVEEGHIEAVRLLKARGIAAADASLYLYLAAHRGHSEVARVFLSPESVNAEIKEFGSTASHAAAHWGHLLTVQLLIDSEADVLRKDKTGKTPIDHALASGETKIVELLLEHLSDLETPLRTEQIRLKWEMVSWLKSIEIRDAIDRGDVLRVKDLLKGRSNVNTLRLPSHCKRRSANHGSWMLPLHRAVMSHSHSILDYLLDKEADFSLVDADGNTALHWAAAAGNYQGLHNWLRHGGRSLVARATNKAGNTPLHLAARYGNTGVMEMLLSKILYIDSRDGLDLDLEARNSDGHTPLSFALASGESGRSLISSELGRDPAGQNNTSRALLERVHFLVLKGANTNIPSLLHHACHGMLDDSRHSRDLVRLLVEHEGLDVNQEDAHGRRPLHLAVRSPDPEVVRRLLEYDGIDANVRDHDGMTALHAAVVAGRKSSVELLLSRFGDLVDINARDHNGRTALHHAVYFRRHGLAEYLLGAGGAAQARDKTNRTPAEIATSMGQTYLASVFSGR